MKDFDIIPTLHKYNAIESLTKNGGLSPKFASVNCFWQLIVALSLLPQLIVTALHLQQLFFSLIDSCGTDFAHLTMFNYLCVHRFL